MEYFVIDRNLERSDVICLDSFVKTLINESSNENFEDNDALEDIAL